MISTILSLISLTVAAFAVEAQAAVKTRLVDYKDGATVLEGFLAYKEGGAKLKPGILIVPEWTGIGPYAKKRAEMLAELGYVAFAVDVYGKGVRPRNPKEAGDEAAKYKNDRKLYRSRMNAALNELKKQKGVDVKRIAAIGYCFGGTGALELARSGADIKGAVTFHGALSSPAPEDARNIKGKILVLHGADDPFVTPAEVSAFEDEMRKAKVDWELVKYSGAVHSFTNPEAGSDASKGAAYNPEADKRSWQRMTSFFQEIF